MDKALEPGSLFILRFSARRGLRFDETVYVTEEYIAELEAEMLSAAEALEFERAAAIRDRIERMRDNIGEPLDAVKKESGPKKGPRGRGRKQTGRVPRPKMSP